ncbi:cysteine desulfurase family protein [Brevundimonas sp.]|uniref:cysteine desulfurase family protein n=1 Tax=Brevundimonas sp. TaxID=1871086 RepID=UPI003F6EF259
MDYQATTPVDPAAASAMWPYFVDTFGNPHSEDHAFAAEAAAAVETARRQVAALIGASAREVVFTSGATEANNLLIAGTARSARREGRTRIVTTPTEHKSVLATVAALEGEGFEAVYVPVGPDGLIDLDRLMAALTEKTALVSVMTANNEIGVLQPITEIAAACRAVGAVFHTDAAQAAGKISLDVVAQGVDLMSVSAHKLYGPKGIGAAFVSRRTPFRPLPILHGGGQEGGLRPGTLPTGLCVGFGAACDIAADRMRQDAERLLGLRGRFLASLDAAGLVYAVNGSLENRLPGNLNLSFDDVDAEALLMTIRPHVAAASGSACTAQSLEPSYVVEALGFGRGRSERAVRFGFGRPTTIAEVDRAASAIIDAVKRLRGVSYRPLAAMNG